MNHQNRSLLLHCGIDLFARPFYRFILAGVLAGVVVVTSHAQVAEASGLAAASGTNTPSIAAAPASDARLLQALAAIDWAQPSDSIPEELVVELQQKQLLQSAALDFLRTLAQAEARFNFIRFLAEAVGSPLYPSAVAWAQNPASAQDRMLGFSLLAQLRESREASQTIALALKALDSERDALVLVAAIGSLNRSDVPPPAQAARVSARLHALTQHPEPEVRANAIQKLADWDRRARYIETDMLRLMSDSSADVRSAAVGAVSITRVSSEKIKNRLLSLVSQPDEDETVRWTAQMNLQHFDLDAQQYRLYLRATQRAEMAGGEKPSPKLSKP